MKEKGMSFADRLRMFIRSMAVQGSWNFPYMQGLGFFYTLAPWLRKVNGDRFQEASKRHMDYFNTHPFMVPYVAGVVARLEEEGRTEESVKARGDLMGPMGAFGDTFFWGKLRPAAILLAVSISFIWPLAAAPVLLVAFNLFHLRERWLGIRNGYGNEDNPVCGLNSIGLKLVNKYSQQFIMAACGFILGICVISTKAPVSAGILFGLGYVLFRVRQKALTVIGLLLAAGLALGVLGVRIGLPWSV